MIDKGVMDGITNPVARGMIIENTRPDFSLVRARIRLDCKAPTPSDEIDINGVCKPTDLTFRLRFSPVRMNAGAVYKRKIGAPFLLECRMLPPKGLCRLTGYEQLMESENPVLIWLRENTTIDEATFKTALNNPYLWVPFCLKYKEYAKKTGTYVMIDYRINNPYEGDGK